MAGAPGISDGCDRCLAFWADPKIPSLLKLAVLCILMLVGDFMAPGITPLVTAARAGDGMSMENVWLVGRGNAGLEALATAVVADRGESPIVDEGDMLCVWRRSCVDVVMGNVGWCPRQPLGP